MAASTTAERAKAASLQGQGPSQTTTAAQIPPAHVAESTFRDYDKQAAQRYLEGRKSAYKSVFIQKVINAHVASGGALGTLLDVGCGPGNSTAELAPHFNHVQGCDVGKAMIETAQATQPPIRSKNGEPVKFSLCDAGQIHTLMPPESVDLITVATAAHWFNMPEFYASAAQILKPNGTIAMWSTGSWYVDPRTTPNPKAIQPLWDELEFEVLRPFEAPGNMHCRLLYSKLAMPWTVDPNTVQPAVADRLAQFDETKSYRQTWNENGIPSDDPDLQNDEHRGYMRYNNVSIARQLQGFGTASMVTRWRAHHKDAVAAGEKEDCIDYMGRRMKEELSRALGYEVPDDYVLNTAGACCLVILKKKKDA